MNLILRLVDQNKWSNRLLKNLKMVTVVSCNNGQSKENNDFYKIGDILLIPEHFLKVVHIDGENFFLITKSKIEELQTLLFKCISPN